jgi:predicted phage-related endonuclease
MTPVVAIRPEHVIGREAWQQARQALRGLGASDVAALYGFGYGRNAEWQLWARLTGRLDPDGETNAQRVGRRLEASVAELFAEDHPDLVVVESPGTICDPDVSALLFATPDRLTVPVRPDIRLWRPLECKAPGGHRAADWRHGAPPGYAIQCQVQAAVGGYDAVWLRALLDRDHTEILIPRDDAFIAELVWRVEAWWARHIEADQPPDGAPPDPDVLASVYRVSIPQALVLDDEDAALMRELRDQAVEAAEQAKVWQGIADTAKATAQKLMGAHEAAVAPDGDLLATWKPKRGRVALDRLIAEHPDIDPEQYRTPSSRTFLWK